MAGSFHTVVLPASPYVPRDLAWSAQDAGEVRTLILDCGEWLLDADTLIDDARVEYDPSLDVERVAARSTGVEVRMRGGIPGHVYTLLVTLMLANGDVEEVTISLPVLPVVSIPGSVYAQGVQLLTDDFGHLIADDFGANLINA